MTDPSKPSIKLCKHGKDIGPNAISTCWDCVQEFIQAMVKAEKSRKSKI